MLGDTRKEDGEKGQGVWQCCINSRHFRLSLLACLLVVSLGFVPVAVWLFEFAVVDAIMIGLGVGGILYVLQYIQPSPENKTEIKIFDDRVELVRVGGGIRVAGGPPSSFQLSELDGKSFRVKNSVIGRSGSVRLSRLNGQGSVRVCFPDRLLALAFVAELGRRTYALKQDR